MKISESTKDELFKVCPTVDFLHEICGAGHFKDVTVSSDGFFLGMEYGDIGYNIFLGKPSYNSIERTHRFLGLLSEEARIEITTVCHKELESAGIFSKDSFKYIDVDDEKYLVL